MALSRTVAVALLVPFATLAGCAQGFQSAKELESAQRSPRDCARRCEELDLRMSAFVLVEKDVAGCVCEPLSNTVATAAAPAPAPVAPAPPPPAPAAPAPAPEPAPAPAPAAPAPAEAPQSRVNRSATGAAAGYVVIEVRRQESTRSGMHQGAQGY